MNNYFTKDIKNKENYQLRKSVVKGVYGCLVAKCRVIISGKYRDKAQVVKSIACSRDVKKQRENMFQRVIQSAKIKGYSKIVNKNIENVAGNINIYARVLTNTNIIVDILYYKFRYFTRDRKIKTITRQGKRYNYVFNKKTGKIITYSRMRFYKDIENYVNNDKSNYI